MTESKRTLVAHLPPGLTLEEINEAIAVTKKWYPTRDLMMYTEEDGSVVVWFHNFDEVHPRGESVTIHEEPAGDAHLAVSMGPQEAESVLEYNFSMDPDQRRKISLLMLNILQAEDATNYVVWDFTVDNEKFGMMIQRADEGRLTPFQKIETLEAELAAKS